MFTYHVIVRLVRPHQGDESGKNPDRSRRGRAIKGQQRHGVNRGASASDRTVLRGSRQRSEPRDLAPRRHGPSQGQGARSALLKYVGIRCQVTNLSFFEKMKR